METLQGCDVVRAEPGLIRAAAPDGGGMPTMEVRFSRFGQWYRIDSWFEGQFMERVERGAFAKTIKENLANIRCLFDHGFDPSIGDKVLGAIEDLREDSDSPVGVVPLFDTSYNRDLVPGLEAGVYGSSMRFRVIKDEWNDEPERSDWNPDGIPERTIKEIRLAEFGPVTFPANPGSTAGLRSATDTFYERLRARDPHRVEEVAARATQIRTPRPDGAGQATPEDTGAARTTACEPATDGHSGGMTPAQRRERLYPTLKEGSS